MSDPNPSNITQRANETFVETYVRLEKEARTSEISRPLAIILYPLVGSLSALVVRLIGRLVHRSR
jgi:hypothetical protein